MQSSGDSLSSTKCISDHNGFCKTHRRLGQLVAVTKKNIKLDENSKKFEVQLSTIQEFTCSAKTTCSAKDKTSEVPSFATSLKSTNPVDCTTSAMINYGVNNRRNITRTAPVVELRRCYERNAM